MSNVRTKITRRKRRSWASGVLTTLVAFALLCAGVLLLSERSGTADARSEEEVRQDAIKEAIDATRNAELALSNENYGDARTHLLRARARLEQLASDGRDASD